MILLFRNGHIHVFTIFCVLDRIINHTLKHQTLLSITCTLIQSFIPELNLDFEELFQSQYDENGSWEEIKTKIQMLLMVQLTDRNTIKERLTKKITPTYD